MHVKNRFGDDIPVPWRFAGVSGSFSLAILVLAQAYKHNDEDQAREEVFEAVRELFSRFEKQRGTTSCKELLGADISTDEGLKKIKQGQFVKKICCGDGGIGQDVAEILEELLKER